MSGDTLGSAVKWLFSKGGNVRRDESETAAVAEMEAILPLGLPMWNVMSPAGAIVVKSKQD